MRLANWFLVQSKVLILVGLIFIPFFSSASVGSSEDKLWGINRYFLLIGQELRPWKDENKDYRLDAYTNLSLGIGIGNFNYFFEKSDYSTSEITGSLTVSRKISSYGLWWQKEMNPQSWGIPYYLAGGGVGRISADSTLYSSTTSAQSDNRYFAGGGLGVRAPIETFWLGFDVRLFFHEEWKPTPFMAILGRAGFTF